uniref:hypothetical protein n=1 Tax=Escherichia coli TaxID=562 RepID=UPI001BC848C2
MERRLTLRVFGDEISKYDHDINVYVNEWLGIYGFPEEFRACLGPFLERLSGFWWVERALRN